MIQLIMGKIKSKCKINLSRCRGWNQIDAPSVRASKICSLEYSRLAAGAHGHREEIQYTESRDVFVSVTVLYVGGEVLRGCSPTSEISSCVIQIYI